MKTRASSTFAVLALATVMTALSLITALGAEPTKAIAVLTPAAGSDVKGTVMFTKSGTDTVMVVAELTGLKPGPHGFHIHEYGDCSGADFNTAGSHFNPTKQPHGGPQDTARHVGDLGNLEADSSGKARLEIKDKVLSLSGPNSIIGYAVIVHEKADDLKTQPTGNAGGRVACGVVGVANPQ